MTITFQDFDKFGREAFANRLTTVISNFSPFYDESFVLSLNARYGAGKTTFLKMWQNKLQTEGYKVIYINAWETDFDDEPLVPIVSALLDNVDKGKGVKNLKAALHGTLGVAALASNSLLGHAIGLNIQDIMKDVEADLKAGDIESIGQELYKEFSYKKSAYETLKKELSNYVGSLDKKPLMVFVDELDRVRPDYAVRFLEAIKHLFSLQGVCFILAVDREQLKASVKQLYGDIDFENYYLRFVTRETDLPEITKIDLKPFIEYQGTKFFDEKRSAQLNFPFKNQQRDGFLNFIEMIARAFRFTPRQTESLFRYFSQVMMISKHDKMAMASWIEATIIMCALFIANRQVYRSIGQGTLSASELEMYIKGLDFSHPEYNQNERRVMYTVLGCYMREDSSALLDEIADIALQYDGRITNVSTENIQNLRDRMIWDLGRTINATGSVHSKSPFQYIFSIIEEWREFIE